MSFIDHRRSRGRQMHHHRYGDTPSITLGILMLAMLESGLGSSWLVTTAAAPTTARQEEVGCAGRLDGQGEAAAGRRQIWTTRYAMIREFFY